MLESLFNVFGDATPKYTQPKGQARAQLVVTREKDFLEQIFCWFGCYDPIYRPATEPVEFKAQDQKSKGK